MRACKDAVSLLSGKAEARSTLPNQTTTIQQLDVAQHQTTRIDSTVAAVDGVPTENSTANDKLTRIVISTVFLLIILNGHM